MLSRNEYVIWTIANKTLRIAVGICNNAEFPMVYVKDLNAERGGVYECYSYYSGAMSTEQAKEIINTAKNKENRKVPNLIKKYFNPNNSLQYYENIGYVQLTDMVSDEWFDSVKKVMSVVDGNRYNGYCKIDVEVEEF